MYVCMYVYVCSCMYDSCICARGGSLEHTARALMAMLSQVMYVRMNECMYVVFGAHYACL
jgi:hypothetical protein